MLAFNLRGSALPDGLPQGLHEGIDLAFRQQSQHAHEDVFRVLRPGKFACRCKILEYRLLGGLSGEAQTLVLLFASIGFLQEPQKMRHHFFPRRLVLRGRGLFRILFEIPEQIAVLEGVAESRVGQSIGGFKLHQLAATGEKQRSGDFDLLQLIRGEKPLLVRRHQGVFV